MEKRLFGLIIEEWIGWASASANEAGELSDFQCENFPEIVINSPRDGRQLENEIRLALLRLKDERPALFERCDAIGVATIGLANRDTNRLMSLKRKPWGASRGYIIDFVNIFRNMFGTEPGTAAPHLAILNDATAKCLAEYYQGGHGTPDILYLMVDEGVNGGAVFHGQSLPTTLHTEIGHIRPSLHPSDEDFLERPEEHGGCPAHIICFEGLMSLARIRNSFALEEEPGPDFTLEDVPEDEAWNLIAYYVAQFCMTGTLTLSPKKIALGGRVIAPGLVPLVRWHFDDLNNGYLTYQEMEDLDEFIVASRLGTEAGHLGAIYVAWEAAFRDPRAKWLRGLSGGVT